MKEMCYTFINMQNNHTQAKAWGYPILFFFCSFVLLFLGSLSAHAAGDWVSQSEGDIQSMRAFFQSGSNYLGTGNSGKTIYSEDGQNWNEGVSESTKFYFDFGLLPDGKILAVGEDGSALSSVDNGLTWQNISLLTTQDINAIDVNGTVGFFVGADGTVYYYVETSKTWSLTSTSSSVDLNDVFVKDNGDGWVVGDDGKIFFTSNSMSWAEIISGTYENLNSISFLDDSVGFSVGSQGSVLKTSDRGLTWSSISISGIGNENLLAVESFGQNIAIAGEKILVVSLDGGVTWDVDTYSDTNYIFYDVFHDADGQIWAAGSDYDVTSLVYKYVPEVIEVIPDPEEEIETETETEIPEALPGQLIKTYCSVASDETDPCRAVYFYSSDGKRHAFPNEKIYFTWYENFDSVVEVSTDFMASLTLGKNVTYHPGTKMVKFLSVPTVYTVSKGGQLRAIASEEIAIDLYGTDWNKQIDDIPDAFYGNYSFGESIESADDYVVDDAKASVLSLNDNF